MVMECFLSGIQKYFNIKQPTNIIYHIKRKIYFIILINTNSVFGKIYHLITSKIGIKGIYVKWS